MTRNRSIDVGSRGQTGDGATRLGDRRGVLLLIVLSMLTLFMMLGAAYLAAATRARTAAKAYAKLTFGSGETRLPAESLLDNVLLRVLRGPAPTGIASTFESLLEDKYGGNAKRFTGVAKVVTSPTSPVLVGTLMLDGSSTARPGDLMGRVLTFVEPGRVATSHRIVRVRGPGYTNAPTQGFEITLDKPFRPVQIPPPTNDAPVVINGREFVGDPTLTPPDKNEPWDAFDAENPFLARITSGPSIATLDVTRQSYGVAASFDNDGDGVPDGNFDDWDLPSFTDAAGNTVDLEASVFIIDLDGRFNVNAHGSLAPTLYADNHQGWTQASGIAGNTLNNAPLGSGYGPGDLQLNAAVGNERNVDPPPSFRKIFDGAFNANDPLENPRLSLTIGDDGTARQDGKRPNGSRFGEGASTPRVGEVASKYGETGAGALTSTNSLRIGFASGLPRPGEPGVNDAPSRVNDRLALPTDADTTSRGVPDVWWNGTDPFNWHSLSGLPAPRGVYNSPPDLHGRMKTITLPANAPSIVPRLIFAQAEWDSPGRAAQDDPYELMLDTRRGVGGWLRSPGSADVLQNPVTLAELDPLLRPYDNDASRAPTRLVTMLGSAAEQARCQLTSESWDTTAVTGPAARRIYGNGDPANPEGWLQTLPVAVPLTDAGSVRGVLSGELARGERFNLNRAFDASGVANAGYHANQPYVAQRQAYFKDLYTVLVALESGTSALPANSADSLAQWAANVVKFRDADSRVIPFEYEQDLRNKGWQGLDNDVAGNDSAESTTRRVVWPAVRPEIVIREVFAWNNAALSNSGMVISLHRPWNAEAHARDVAAGNDVDIPAEPCDYALDTLSSGGSGRPTNTIDLGKKANPAVLGGGAPPDYQNVYDDVAGETYPIWRLRIVVGGQTRYVRFDAQVATPSSSDEILISPPPMNGNAKPKMGVDSTLTLISGSTISIGMPPMPPSMATIDAATHGGTQVNVPDLAQVAALGNGGSVFLERLSDPSVTLESGTPLPSGLTESGNPPRGEEIWKSDPAVIGAADQTTVPVRYIEVDRFDFKVVQPTSDPTNLETTHRENTNDAQAFWRTPSGAKDRNQDISANATLVVPGQIPGTANAAWFVWPNRPFVSAAELLLVPQGDSLGILESYTKPDPGDWATLGLPLSGMAKANEMLFDAVHVPTRFCGVHQTVTGNIAAATDISPITNPVNQLSSFREPGRVNLNTITSEEVWNAVVAGPLDHPIETGTSANLGLGSSPHRAVENMLQALAVEHGGTAVKPDTASVLPVQSNPLHSIYTATRLANTVTTRSNVFAIWITLREQVAGDPDSVRYHRGFYIVDRSIPVGFEEGKDHNVWDCVRLRRIIE